MRTVTQTTEIRAKNELQAVTCKPGKPVRRGPEKKLISFGCRVVFVLSEPLEECGNAARMRPGADREHNITLNRWILDEIGAPGARNLSSAQDPLAGGRFWHLSVSRSVHSFPKIQEHTPEHHRDRPFATAEAARLIFCRDCFL